MPTQGTAIFTPPESAIRRGGQTVFTILAAISACHLLNDLVQATIPSLYPLFQRIFGLSLGQIGMITFTYQIDRIALSALCRHGHGQKAHAVFARARDGLLARRPGADGLRADLRMAAGGRLAGGARLLRLSSGIVARGPTGLRRPARPRAVALPVRRKLGLRARPAAGPVAGAFRAQRARRPAPHRVVLRRRACRHRDADLHRRLVQGTRARRRVRQKENRRASALRSYRAAS